MIRWLRANDVMFEEPDDRTAFWIVGSAPDPAVIEPFYTRRTQNE
jgi:hypothetical protein